MSTEVDVATPKFGQPLALDFDVFDVFAVGGFGNGRDFLVEVKNDGLGGFGVEFDFDGLGVEVAGGLIPLATFATIPAEFDHLAVGAVVSLVFVEQNLHGVFSGGYVFEAFDGVTKGAVVEGLELFGFPVFYVDAKSELAFGAIDDLEAGLGFVVFGQHQHQPAIKLSTLAGGETHQKLGGGGSWFSALGKSPLAQQKDGQKQRPGIGFSGHTGGIYFFLVLVGLR